MKIDLDELMAELQKCGTDERIIRPLMVLARHVNSSLENMKTEVEDVADERITKYHRRNDHY